MTPEESRKRFEEWCEKEKGYSTTHYGENYPSPFVQCWWEGWQAALLSLPDAPPREPTDEMISAGAGDGVAAQLVDLAGIWRAMYDAAPQGDT